MNGLPNHAGDQWIGVCFFGGGGGTTSTNTIQSTTPWSAQQGPLESIYDQAQALDTSAIPQYFPNDTYAPLDAQQQGLMSNVIGQTSAGGTTALQNANATLSNTESPAYTQATSGTFGGAGSVLGNELSSSYLNPNNSPAYQTAVSNAIAAAVPNAAASFINGNRSDSGLGQAATTSAAANAAGGLAQQQYDVNQGIQNQAATQASNNYLTQLNQQNQGALVAPMIDQQSLANATTGLNVAGMNQTNAQNQINANVAAYNYGQMLPWNQLGLEESAITGTGNPGGAANSTSTSPYFTNPMADILGGATAVGGALAGASSLAQLAGYSGLLLGTAPLL